MSDIMEEIIHQFSQISNSISEKAPPALRGNKNGKYYDSAYF
jgi:hypothetical protein